MSECSVISLIIRGDKDEHAVLCSEDKTYDLKIADTSNLLLFVPGCKTPDQLPDIPASPQLMHAQVTGEVIPENVILSSIYLILFSNNFYIS